MGSAVMESGGGLSWLAPLAVCLVLAPLGAGIDKHFMSRQARSAWYDRCMSWWLTLEQSSFDTLPSRTARRFGVCLDCALAVNQTLGRRVLRLLLISAVALVVTTQAGRVWDQGWTSALTTAPQSWSTYLVLFPLIAIASAPADIATIVITRALLRKMQKASLVGVAGWVVVDLALALFLACIAAGAVVPARILLNMADYPGPFGLLEQTARYPLWLWQNFEEHHSHKYLLLASSMLIPSALLVGTVFVLGLSKVAVKVVRTFLQVLLEQHSPHELPVFTTVAFLITLCNGVVTATSKLMSLA